MRDTGNPSSLSMTPSSITLFSGVTSGSAIEEKIAFGNYRDECFVLCSTDPHHPLKKETLDLTIDTALWAFKLVRLRPFYRLVPEKLLYRIIRSTNILLWQKQREPQYSRGLTSTLLVSVATGKNFLVGFVGGAETYLWSGDKLTLVVARKGDREAVRTMQLGKERYGIQTATCSAFFVSGDTYLLVNKALVPLMEEEIVRKYLSARAQTNEELVLIARDLLQALVKEKKGGMFGLGLIRRIKTK